MHDIDSAWTVVLPIKGGPAAKSRLRAGWERDAGRGRDGGLTARLAAAIAADTLAAAASCPLVHTVLVVTADLQVRARVREPNAVVVPERAPGAGLAAAIEDGLRAATGQRQGPVAILLGDVPALRPEDLCVALWTAAVVLGERQVEVHHGGMAVVADAEGSGTVLLAALDAADLAPAFGPASFAEHERRGAVAIGWELTRLRRDVDTPADLRDAAALGAGPATAAVLASHRELIAARSSADPGSARTP